MLLYRYITSKELITFHDDLKENLIENDSRKTRY
jgi:hypothetical protein